MSTARDLIKRSMRLLNAIATGETPSADELVDGLSSLNGMIDSWSTEGLLINARVREEFTLVAGTAAYTMGSSGTFNTTRPLKIEAANIEDQTGDFPEYPVQILTLAEWAQITIKSTQSELPQKLYAEGTYPLETINLWPVPSAANKLVLYSRKVLTALASVNTDISFPPGYEDALVHNLAIRLAPEYAKPVPSEVIAVASETKANIKRRNMRPNYMAADDATLGRGGYNILIGE